ncbi:BED zinc finger [Ancylostoma duodenale]|uniref:BED zinc finger n=1 Tax=Ancylostoma duodenale TaxID=51022 RepID=A0A0C2HFU7_9BILA|nr:BED zinc finger [Ancylostoma duodenale]
MSVVWNLYKKMKGEGGEDLAVCKICSKTVKIPRSKTTTNMLSHLRESHEEDMIEAEKQTTSREKKAIESQTKLDELFKRKMNLSTKRSLDRKVALLIAKASLSLNVVSLDAFKDLLSSLNSAYSPPCRKTILSIMRDQVEELDEVNQTICVRAALEFDAVKAAIGNVKRIVSKMNRSAKVKTLYKRLLKEAGLPIVLPATDCPTRWGSTYTMVCDVLNALPALENLLVELKMPAFESEELRLLEAIQVFLAPFYTMTKQVCHKDSCVSMYIPVGKILIASTKRNCQAARREAKQFGECLLSKLRHYFGEWFEDETLCIAAFCDPRFAFLDTVLSAESWRSTADKFIALKAKSPTGEEVDNLNEIRTNDREGGEAPVWDLLTTQNSSKRDRNANDSITEDELQIEIQQYAVLLKKGRPTYESDPIEWWRNHCEEFPLIAKAVPQYLVVPATSVDCERLFSLAGIIYGNKRRGHLKGENARLLLMLKVNSNEKVGRSSKAWNPSEARRYGRKKQMEEVYDDSTTEDEHSSSGEEGMEPSQQPQMRKMQAYSMQQRPNLRLDAMLDKKPMVQAPQTVS